MLAWNHKNEKFDHFDINILSAGIITSKSAELF